MTPNQSIEPKSDFDQNLEEIEILRKVKPFLERRQADNEVLYKCNCCQFISIDLKSIAFHINKEHLQQTNFVNNSVQQLTQTNTSQDINNCLKTSKISERKTNQMKIIDSINKSIDKKKSKSKDRVWKPFKCDFNDCD